MFQNSTQSASATRVTVVKDKFAIAFFKTQDLGNTSSSGSVELKLTGTLKDGTKFEGVDTVKIIGKGKFSSLSFLLANLHETLARFLELLRGP